MIADHNLDKKESLFPQPSFEFIYLEEKVAIAVH